MQSMLDKGTFLTSPLIDSHSPTSDTDTLMTAIYAHPSKGPGFLHVSI